MMVHMNAMLVPIDVFVDLEYDKQPQTTHLSSFKHKKNTSYKLGTGQARCPISPAEVPDLGFLRSLKKSF